MGLLKCGFLWIMLLTSLFSSICSGNRLLSLDTADSRQQEVGGPPSAPEELACAGGLGYYENGPGSCCCQECGPGSIPPALQLPGPNLDPDKDSCCPANMLVGSNEADAAWGCCNCPGNGLWVYAFEMRQAPHKMKMDRSWNFKRLGKMKIVQRFKNGGYENLEHNSMNAEEELEDNSDTENEDLAAEAQNMDNAMQGYRRDKEMPVPKQMKRGDELNQGDYDNREMAQKVDANMGSKPDGAN